MLSAPIQHQTSCLQPSQVAKSISGRDPKPRLAMSRHQLWVVTQNCPWAANHVATPNAHCDPKQSTPGHNMNFMSRPRTIQSILSHVATTKGCCDFNPSSPGRNTKTMSRPRPCLAQVARTVAPTLGAWRPACHNLKTRSWPSAGNWQ